VSERPLRVLGVGDGKSIIFLRWAWRLAELGHDVHIVSDRITDKPGELDGITAHDVREIGGLSTRVKGVRKYFFGPAIAKLARRLDADVLHGHYLLPYGYWAAASGFHPLVESPWNTDIFTYGRERRRGRKWVREAVAAADRYVVSSAGNTEETIRLGADPTKIARIVWYVDLRPYGPDNRDPDFPKRFGWPDDSFVILSLRNYRENTNLDVVIRAFSRLLADVPKARLVLAGRSGTVRPQLEEIVRELGLEDRVAFTFAASDELPLFAASADVGISLATTDATPASMIESMASRVAMVMGDAITIDEWITQGEGGEVVPVRDEDAVYEALKKLSLDPELRRAYGERNERVVRERLGEHPGRQLERVYRELLANGRR
jgi:glycosyltransferase involved in cell wall biosynthesis